VQFPNDAAQCDETLLVKVVRVESRPGGQWLHRCALISELEEESVLSLIGPEAAQAAKAERSRRAAARRRPQPSKSSFWGFFRNRSPQARLGILVAAMLTLGVSVGGLVRLLRSAGGW
jgi:hypothetical protein